MPSEYYWINLTAAINLRLRATYKIEEVQQQMPSDQLLLLEILLEAERQP